MEFKHTPGPWSIDVVDDFSANILGPSDGFCCDVLGSLNMWGEERKANASLIATAPELLEALVGIYEALDSAIDLTPERMCKARAVIAKALGK